MGQALNEEIRIVDFVQHEQNGSIAHGFAQNVFEMYDISRVHELTDWNQVDRFAKALLKVAVNE